MFTGLKQTMAPFNVGFPPHTPRVTDRGSFLDEPISTYVVPVGDNHVLLRGRLLFRCTLATQLQIPVKATPRENAGRTL